MTPRRAAPSPRARASSTPSAPGTGFPFVATDGVFNATSETGYADIPLTTINLLSLGNHTISVRGKNAFGWGARASIDYLIDRTAPTFTGITLTPSTETAAASVTLTVVGSADPLVTGLASGVAGGEYWIDTAAPARAPAGLHRPTPSIPVTTLTTGTHTIGARIRDAAGNWSTITQTATVTVRSRTASSPTASTPVARPGAGPAARPTAPRA